MPRFALIDPSAPEPRPVLGWYDTDALDYPALPDAAALMPVPAEQWDARMDLPCAAGGRLVAAPAPAAAVPLDPIDRTFEGGEAAWLS